MNQSVNQMETIYEPAKETAKKIRAALKSNFPGVKFSVRTDVYSMGSSVNVSWDDLPLADEVEKVTNQFVSGSFNGMEDIYESTGYVFEGKKYNGAKYIFTKRNLSDDRREMIKTWMKENYAEVNENSYDYYYHFNQAELKMMAEQNKPAEVEEVVTIPAQKENNQTITKEENITVELKLNDQLNGIELYFSGIPSEGTRQLLKENGFRWSKYNKCWYVKQSDKTLLFAEALVSAFNDIVEPGEVEEVTNEHVEVVEVKTVHEMAANDGILINDSELVGRKVIGNWGAMHSNDYGIIIAETIYNEVIVKWDQDGENKLNESYYEIKNLIENEKIDAIGVYLLPIENNDSSEVVEVETVEELTYSLEPQKQPQTVSKPAKVLDFNSKFKQRQKSKETESMINHFIDNILPYMNNEEISQLQHAYSTNDENELNNTWQKLMLLTAVRRAKDDVLKQS